MSRTPLVLAFALASALALGACSKNQDEGTTQPQPGPQTPPATTPAEPPPAAEPAPPVEEAVEVVRVTGVDLGTAVGDDQRITDPTTTFKTDDTIYAAVSTQGASPNAVLHARWTFGDDQVVNESSQTIAPNGPAVTSFHISKADGWPAGEYKVQISLDGEPVATEEFKVEE